MQLLDMLHLVRTGFKRLGLKLGLQKMARFKVVARVVILRGSACILVTRPTFVGLLLLRRIGLV